MGWQTVDANQIESRAKRLRFMKTIFTFAAITLCLLCDTFSPITIAAATTSEERANSIITFPASGFSCSTPSFANANNLSLPGRPFGIASGDLNGDKKIDLVVTYLPDQVG